MKGFIILCRAKEDNLTTDTVPRLLLTTVLHRTSKSITLVDAGHCRKQRN